VKLFGVRRQSAATTALWLHFKKFLKRELKLDQ